jgi:hypothetical protein
MITLYPAASKPDTFTHVDPINIIDRIRSGEFQHLIDTLNSLDNEADQQRFKAHELPAVCWSGEFTRHSNDSIIKHSGFIALDFDKIPPDEMPRIRQRLTEAPSTWAVFLSPRRNGLKVIVRIPSSIDRHKDYARGVADYYRSPYLDHFEDIGRLCFVSYDPDLYLNTEAEEFTRIGQQPKTKLPERTERSIGKTDAAADIAFMRIMKWQSGRDTFQPGNRHRYVVGVASACVRFAIDQYDAMRFCRERFEQDGFRASEIDKIVRSCYGLYMHTWGNADSGKALPVEEPVQYRADQFPLDVLPTEIVMFITELNRTLKYSKDFLAVSAMFAIATLNGNKYKLRVKNGWTAPTIFWFMVVGEPGTMKSHPVSTMLEPIRKIDKESKLIYDAAIKDWEQQEKKPRKPQFRQSLVSDYTLEALHEVHSYNKRGLGLYKDEIVGFVNDMNKYRKGSDEQFWLESFNNSSYIINRKGADPIMINDININIIGSIQPIVLSEIAKRYNGNGLIDRFLYTQAEDAIHAMSLDDIGSQYFTWWNLLMRYANDQFEYLDEQDSVTLDLDHDVLQEMIKIDSRLVDMQRSDDEVYEIRNYISKMKTYLPRFALLLSIMDYLCGEAESIRVTVQHMKSSRRIIEYFLQSARAVFFEADRKEEISQVRQSLKALTKAEKIVHLARKGYKQKDICLELKTPPSYVSKVLKDAK